MRAALDHLLSMVTCSLLSFTVTAQSTTDTHEPWKWAASAGVVANDKTTFELSLIRGLYESGGPCTFPTYVDLRAGMEYRDTDPAPIIGPKLGAEMCALLFCARLSAVDYIQGDVHDPRIVPEIGFSFPTGLLQICYGWSIPLSEQRIDGIGYSRWTFSVNLDPAFLDQ